MKTVRTRNDIKQAVWVVLFLLLVGLFADCGMHRESSVAHVSKDSQGLWKIRLDATEWVAGGPCNISLPPSRIHLSHWIYTSTLYGEVPANQLFLTYYDQGTNFPQSALRGKVTFSGGKMNVSLRCPIYADNGIARYESYALNGRYKLQVQ
jgi:hypothetical protein